MTTNEIADRLVDLCRNGKWEEAQRELFAQDAISIEPHATPAFEKETKGLNAIIEKGYKFQGMTEEMHNLIIDGPLVAANAIAFKLVMDITMKGRPRDKWEEICVYHVENGKIISEQFFI
jgi:SnoaL-like domain